jgi:hypothetical protein
LQLKRLKTLAVALTLSLGLVAIYGQHFFKDQLIQYDDPFVVTPLAKVETFKQYVQALKTGVIFDLQPVRDLSYKMNYWMADWTGRPYFHQTNVFCFLVALLGVYALLLEWFPGSRWGNILFTHLLAFSPLYVSSVAWITARKHLLSLMFIVWATWFLIRYLKGSRWAGWALSFCYGFSVFSQPMNILWPALVGIYLIVFGQGQRWKVLIPSLFIALGVGLLNLKYYGAQYEYISGGNAKFASSDIHGVSSSLLMLGRYAFQTFFPYWTSIGDYGFDSWQNLVGLGGLVLFYSALGKWAGRGVLLVAIAGFVALLFPVVGRITQHSGNDTYVLSASFFLAILAYVFLRGLARAQMLTYRLRPWVIGLALVFIPLEVLFSQQKASVWSDRSAIFRQAYEVEPSIPTQAQYAEALMLEGEFNKAFLIVQDIYEQAQMNSKLDTFIARLIISAPGFDDQKKIEYFDRYKLKSRKSRLFRALILNRLGRFKEAEQLFGALVSEPYSLRMEGVGCDVIAEQWGFACKKIGREDCSSLPMRVEEKCASEP